MGTTIYGSYDQLIIERRGIARLLHGGLRRRLAVPIARIRTVRAERGGRVVVLDIDGGERVEVEQHDADAVAADLVRCGVGAVASA